MHWFTWIFGALLAAIWMHRLVDTALGMPKVAEISTPAWDRRPQPTPRVSIIVPARNEAEHVGAALGSLLALDYPDFEIIAVDDRSTDETGVILDRMAGGKLQVIHITELPDGWLGKTHAMWTAAQRATGEWLLFTDADVVYRPDALRRAVAYAEAERADHLVLFPTHALKSFGERMMIGFFQLLFVFGHRPWKVADPNTKDHMGIGAFNLVRRRVYEAVGTHRALRLEVIDDMKLGELVKESGYRQRNVFGRDLLSIWWARGTFGVVHNLTKNFFALMHFSPRRVLGAMFLLLVLNIGPFAGLILAPGWSRVVYALAVAVVFAIYLGESWYSDVKWYFFLFHPISTVLFAYILLRSMLLTLRHGGVIWRGTKYPLEDLKAWARADL